MNYKVVVSYDGTNFHGWAKQDNVLTIQQSIEECLSRILNTSITIHGSGRTDARVHAVGQVFSFHAKTAIKPKELIKVLNDQINDGIYFKSIKIVDGLFHARFSSSSKTYKYYLDLGVFDVFRDNYVNFYNKHIDLKLLKRAAKLFIGTHDFKSFSTSALENTTRTIYAFKLAKKDNNLIITITGNGFLRNMVRMIVGSLLDLNEGKKQLNDFASLLNKPLKGSAITKAKASGLYLYSVKY